MDFIEQNPDDENRRNELLLAFLNSEEPAWRDEDHPDIVALGTYEWVRALRRQCRSGSE
jgi:hypothetical protein